MTNRVQKIADTLSRPHILFYAIPWLILLTVLGTLAQKDLGLYDSQRIFFSSWIVWFGPLPLPGGMTTIAVIFTNLLFKFLMKSEWTIHKAGIHITHLGVLMLILGGLITGFTSKEGYLVIVEGERSNIAYAYDKKAERIMPDTIALILPFAIELKDFRKDMHPATDMARAYESDIVLHDGAPWPHTIEMNKPLRYKGYTIFQSSFDDSGEKEITILSVMQNSGRLFPYIASIIIAAGLLIHLMVRGRK